MTLRAVIAGVTGLAGSNLAEHLISKGWEVHGVARKPQSGIPGVRPIAADLLELEALRSSLAGVDPTHVFITTWVRRASEEENCAVNGALVRNLLAALDPSESLRHVALVTGLKHYLGPFEDYAKAKPETPLREEMPRLPVANFFYTQEDELFEAARRRGFTWSVHRAHTIIGYALGNAMNMGVTLAVYATICRETGRPFVFPGSAQQWMGLTDVTDARVLARTWNGPRPPKPAGIRRSTSSTGTSSAGDGSGRSLRPTSESRPLPTRAARRRSSRNWRMRGRSGPISRRSMPSPKPISANSRRPGIPTWISAQDRGRDRHDKEPRGRLPRIPANTWFIPGLVRQVAGRADHPSLMIEPK